MVIIHPRRIVDNPFQVRSDYGDVAELAARIDAKREELPATRGLLQVPIGRLVYADGREDLLTGEALAGCLQRVAEEGLPSNLLVQLAFGHRRLRAFRQLCDESPQRYDGMPVNIVDLSDDQMLDAVWSENRERKDISAVEEGELMRRKLERIKADGGSQADVAAAWGVSRPTVANRLRLLELPHELQDANRAGKLSERHLLALAPVVKVMELARDTKWNESAYGWNGPIAPEAFIENVMADPETTSDEIREYFRKAQAFAGEEIPPALVELELAGEGIVQATCRGCHLRLNAYCFHQKCMDRKTIAFGDRAAWLLSEELDVAVASNGASEVSYDQRRMLQMLVDAGMTENLRLVWQPGGAAVWAAPDWDWSKNTWQDDGRYGVVYVHKDGEVSQEEYEAAQATIAAAAAAVQETADGEANRPDVKTLQAWSEQERLLCDYLRQVMYGELTAGVANASEWYERLRPLLALLMHASMDKLTASGNPDEIVRSIADHAWKNVWLQRSSADQLAPIAERMGVGLDPEVVALAEMLGELGRFYRDTWGGQFRAERLLAANERWLSPEFDGAALGLLPDAGQSLDGWLTRAIAEATERLAAANDEEE